MCHERTIEIPTRPRARVSFSRRLGTSLTALALAGPVACSVAWPVVAVAAELPARLADTGLYADFASRTIEPRAIAYQPRYPLWTDGELKSRWLLVPEGASIDASVSDTWVFPVGTKIWKQFAVEGRAIETRYLTLDESGSWRYATYVWNADQTDAILAPERGVRNAAEVEPGVQHDVPGRYDCLACHTGQRQPVLGVSTVQLAADLAEGGRLASLVATGVIRGLPRAALDAGAHPFGADPREEAVLGYLHGNCGHCHNREGALASLGLDLRLEPGPAGGPDGSSGWRTAARETLFDVPAQTTARVAQSLLRVTPGDPEASQLVERMQARDGLAQMPPLGTRLVDRRAVESIRAWILSAQNGTEVPTGPSTGTP